MYSTCTWLHVASTCTYMYMYIVHHTLIITYPPNLDFILNSAFGTSSSASTSNARVHRPCAAMATGAAFIVSNLIGINTDISSSEDLGYSDIIWKLYVHVHVDEIRYTMYIITLAAKRTCTCRWKGIVIIHFIHVITCICTWWLEMKERKKESKTDRNLRQMKKWKWVASGGIRTRDTLHSGQMLLPTELARNTMYIIYTCNYVNHYVKWPYNILIIK